MRGDVRRGGLRDGPAAGVRGGLEPAGGGAPGGGAVVGVPPGGGGCEGMCAVEVYATVRQLVFVEGLSRREVARRLGLSRDTVGKMCSFAEPPGYVRTKPVERPKLGPLGGVSDAILAEGRGAPATTA